VREKERRKKTRLFFPSSAESAVNGAEEHAQPPNNTQCNTRTQLSKAPQRAAAGLRAASILNRQPKEKEEKRLTLH
jgi:hypothetical protein